MRVTLNIPETLMAEAMSLSARNTRSAVIEDALKNYIRKIRIQGLKKYRGRVCLDLDMDALRKRL